LSVFVTKDSAVSGDSPAVEDPRSLEDPREVVAGLAASTLPFLLGVRHHSPALAAMVPALLDAAGIDVLCIELPVDFQSWLPHLAHPGTVAPVALAGTRKDGQLGFYPFADFSPELAAVRWARERGVEVLCCDLPLSDPGWSADAEAATPDLDSDSDAGSGVEADGRPADRRAARSFATALTDAGTGREGDDLWDRAVEVLAPGCTPEAVRRAALGVGWALRQDAQNGEGVRPTDLAREAHMRRVIAAASAGGSRRVGAVIGSFHASALTVAQQQETATASEAAPTESDHVTSLVPYAFDLLDSRSGYPAGIRDPQWQQAVFNAGGDPERLHDAAARTVTALCRELRAAGHTAGTGEAAETVRVAGDLARLRALPAPGRGELLEAVTTVLGQGEPLGRGRALARALDTVMVGTGRGRTAPGTPRSGLGPAVEAELAALRLPCPEEPASREMRLDPLRSDLDRRREILLQRLTVCGAGYGEQIEVAGTGDGAALSTRWRLAWTPAVPARLDLASARGVTPAQAAAGTLREDFRRASAEGGATCALVLENLRAAAGCDLPDLVADRLDDAAAILPATATLPELLAALDLMEALCRQHLPGTTERAREKASALIETLIEAAVRALPGLAGSEDPNDAAALVALADRAGERRLGLRLDDALDALARTGSPLIQGTALAVRVLLELDKPDALGERAAGWVDAATDRDSRRRLSKLLAGVLTAAAPLLQSAPAVLDPLMDRIDALTDQGFLDRLPALRGGFDSLSPAARDRLLRTVTERLGDRLDLTLNVPPALLAAWTVADAAGLAALRSLRIPLPDSLGDVDPGPISAPDPTAESGKPAEATTPTEPSTPAESDDASQPSVLPQASVSLLDRLSPADRWRLLLGRQSSNLPGGARRLAHALDELYGAGRGEGASGVGGGQDSGGAGQEGSFPTAREWAEELGALFGGDVREEVLARAADAGRTDVLGELDPAAVRPSVELLTSVLSLAGGMPEQQLARLRPLVRRLVDELAKELATRLRPAMAGLTTPRPTRRPGGRLDLARTLRANLVHTRRYEDGRTVVIPERPIFSTRARREADWRLILVVDVSGSMEASVVWSALTAAVLGGVPTLSTHFLAFSTRVIDLTEKVSDPLSLLLEVRVGGGTHIAAGLAHARTLVTVPSRTLVVVVSDFEEGYPLGGLLGEVRALASSGVHLLGCAALDDRGAPRYSVPIAQQLVAAGMPVAALSPLALARWVGDRLRGER
jgi:Mg-chelatase subunit ChlD